MLIVIAEVTAINVLLLHPSVYVILQFIANELLQNTRSTKVDLIIRLLKKRTRIVVKSLVLEVLDGVLIH